MPDLSGLALVSLEQASVCASAEADGAFAGPPTKRRREEDGEDESHGRQSDQIKQIDTSGEREKVSGIDSANEEDLRVLSVMCYTYAWDALINAVKVKSMKPHLVIYDDNLWKEQIRVFPMFIDFSNSEHTRAFFDYMDSYDNSPSPTTSQTIRFRIQNPTFYCRTNMVVSMETAVSDENVMIMTVHAPDSDGDLEQRVRTTIDNMWNDLRVDPKDTSNPRFELARTVFDNAVETMMRALDTCFYPLSDWTLKTCASNDDPSTPINPYVVRYRGQSEDKGGPRIFPVRYNSSTASIQTAMDYAFEPNSTIHAFLLEQNALVLDVRTFLGSDENPFLVCFELECELLVKPGMAYTLLTKEEYEDMAKTGATEGVTRFWLVSAPG